MRVLVKRAGMALKAVFETTWNYLGSLAAVCLFASVLGLGIYHAVVQDMAPRYYCFAGVHNPAGAEPPEGIVALGADASPGVPHVRLEYDSNGRLQRMKSVDADGRLSPLPASRVAEQRLFYDAAGRLRKRENRDPGGSLAEDAQGVAVREFEYDAAGRLTRTLFRNAAGALTAPPFPGYAESRVSYDAAGRPVQELYLGAEGKPVRNAAGEERVEYRYGADGSVTRRNFVDGAPANNAAGFAVEETRNSKGYKAQYWKDTAGKAVEHPLVGAVEVHHELSASDDMERRCFLGADGEPRVHCRACAEHLVRCNSRGLPVWEFFSGADGAAVNHPALGYAERVYSYSPQGNLIREFYRDAAGNPAPVYEQRHANTEAGHFVLSLQRDGSSTVQPR